MNTELEEYSKAREALIRSDLAWRRDQVSTQLSEEDATSTTKADATLRRIRQEEADTIWQKDYPTIPHPFPGMEFLTGVFHRLAGKPQISDESMKARRSFKIQNYSRS